MVHGVVEGAVDGRKDGRKVAELGAGDFGREIALLSHGPRTATGTSTTPTQVLVTDHPVRPLLDSLPELQRRVLEALAERLHAGSI